MTDAELPGRDFLPDDLHIADQRAFLRQIPELIGRLRMRNPSRAFLLNLSEASLSALDQEIATIISELPGGYGRIAVTIDRELVRQVTAYVGEVIVRNRNGQWQTKVQHDDSGPIISFPTSQLASMTTARRKAIDIYEQVLVTILEGENFADWYSAEVLDGSSG